MFQFLAKIFLTPENIIGIILKLIEIIGMCFIFVCLNLKWWKSLIPFYDNFILYTKVFKHKWMMFFFNILSLLIQFRCVSLFKKHILGNVWNIIKTKNFDNLDIDIIYLILLIVIWIFTYLVCFIFEKITNYRILKLLELPFLFQVITFIIPDIFLLIDAIYYLHKKKKQQG